MALNKIESAIWALADPVLTEIGYELVELNYVKEAGNWFLRFFIDKPEGINIDDCSLVSQKVGDLLDREDLIPHNYYLEVSSPGIFRPLKKPEDFERFKGEQVEIATFAPVDGKKKWLGKLAGLADEHVIIKGDQGGEVRIPLPAVAKARLHPDI